MPQRFIKKNPYKKRIRPASRIYKPLNVSAIKTVEEPEVKDIKTENNEAVKTQVEEMETNNNINKLKAIVGSETKLPKRRVKVEKKDKGLFERTENSTILITEDNKMMLND